MWNDSAIWKKSTKNRQLYVLLMFLIICLYTGFAGVFFIITNKLKLNHKIKSWIKDFLFHSKGPNFLCNLLPVEIRVTFKYNADQPWVYFRDICWVSSGSAFLKYVSTSGLLWIHSEFHSMVHCSHWLADPFCILQFYCL